MEGNINRSIMNMKPGYTTIWLDLVQAVKKKKKFLNKKFEELRRWLSRQKHYVSIKSRIQIPSAHITSPAWLSIPVTPALESQFKQISRTHWLAGPSNQNGKLSFTETCLKEARQKVLQEDTWHPPLVSACTPTGTCTLTCMHHTHTTHTHTFVNHLSALPWLNYMLCSSH